VGALSLCSASIAIRRGTLPGYPLPLHPTEEFKMTYQMNVGITIFGSSLYPEWDYDAIILEYKQFIENNSKFSLNLIINKYPALANGEIGYWSGEIPHVILWDGGTCFTILN